jgi:hypothetical protein
MKPTARMWTDFRIPAFITARSQFVDERSCNGQIGQAFRGSFLCREASCELVPEFRAALHFDINPPPMVRAV